MGMSDRDVIIGDAGDDTLIGGEGVDFLTGGNRNLCFLY